MERRKYHVILSLSISRPRWLSIFLSQEQLSPPCLVCVLTAWLGDGQAGRGPQIWPERNVDWTPFVARVHSQLSGEQSKSFFLADAPGVALGRMLSCTFLWGCLLCVQGVVQYRQKYLLPLCHLKPDKIFERISFERILMWLNCPMLAKLEASIQSLIGMFLKAFPLKLSVSRGSKTFWSPWGRFTKTF